MTKGIKLFLVDFDSLLAGTIMVFALWQPPVDILRGQNHWCVRVELAGICPGQVQIHIEHKAIIVRGSRRDYLAANGFSYQSLEINYSAFERRIGMPFEIDKSRVNWDYQDGMLLIQIHPIARIN